MEMRINQTGGPPAKEPPGSPVQRVMGSITRGMRSIAVTSGKGGVGKSSVVANLAFLFAKMGLRVLILDADMGLANIDVLLGLTPRYTMKDYLDGSCGFREIVLRGPGGVRIIPAGSGVLEMTDLGKEQLLSILGELGELKGEHDLLIIDTAAGVSSNVLKFNTIAEEVVVVVTPEPTSITDAYALIKLMSMKFKRKRFSVLGNNVKGAGEADQVFNGLNAAVERFLSFSLSNLGFIPWDRRVANAIRSQRAFADLFPEAEATRMLRGVAERLRDAAEGAESAREFNILGPYG